MMNIFHKIKIDFSTYILILMALLAGYIKNISLILIIVIIHELGHVFFFKLFNITIEKIIIYPFGGVTYINKKIHERIYKDILISIGGIFFQIILFILFYLLYRYNIIVLSTYNLFKLYNINIIIFNLIPIIPLDGSKLLLSILTKFFPFKRSYLLMIIIGFISLLLFIIFNFVYQVNDLILYIFLIFKLIEVIKEFKYIMNKFYLERIMYNNYYDKIISNCHNINNLRLDKYYYFKEKNHYVNEKDYLKKYRYFN